MVIFPFFKRKVLTKKALPYLTAGPVIFPKQYLPYTKVPYSFARCSFTEAFSRYSS